MKDIRKVNINVTYDPNHKGAHYTIDGEHFMNAGDLAECLVKAAHGLDPVKDGNGAFDKVADVPEYNASVKSSNATVCGRKLADDKAEFIEKFLEQSVANSYWYVIVDGNKVTTYKMNVDTFRKFLTKFANINERGALRLPRTTTMMLRWLDTNA